MKWIILVLLIVGIPLGIWRLICKALIRYGQKETAEVAQKLSYMEPRKRYTATVISTEIMNGWSVLMCKADDGSQGFYLKTTDRSVKPGAVLDMIELNDFPGMEELLRHCQVRPDDEYMNRITALDYRRILDKLRSEQNSGDYFIRLGGWLWRTGCAVIIPACLLIAVAVILLNRNR